MAFWPQFSTQIKTYILMMYIIWLWKLCLKRGILPGTATPDKHHGTWSSLSRQWLFTRRTIFIVITDCESSKPLLMPHADVPDLKSVLSCQNYIMLDPKDLKCHWVNRHVYLWYFPLGILTQIHNSEMKVTQNKPTARRRGSSDSTSGIQPIDQSKHSHSGHSKSQPFNA